MAEVEADIEMLCNQARYDPKAQASLDEFLSGNRYHTVLPAWYSRSSGDRLENLFLAHFGSLKGTAYVRSPASFKKHFEDFRKHYYAPLDKANKYARHAMMAAGGLGLIGYEEPLFPRLMLVPFFGTLGYAYGILQSKDEFMRWRDAPSELIDEIEKSCTDNGKNRLCVNSKVRYDSKILKFALNKYP